MEDLRVSVRDGRFTTTVAKAGSGPPLVFLHGAGGPMVGAPFLDELAKRFTVYAPAHPGFGPGEGIEHIDDVLDFVVYYLDLLDELGLERTHLIGHSLGGMLAAELAALARERFDRLVLVCPAGLWLDDAPIPDFFTFTPQQLIETAVADPQGPVGRMLAAQFENPDAIIDMYRSLASAGKLLWPIPDKGLKKRIHRLTLPTLIVWGAADKLIPPVYGDHFRKLIPGAKLVTLHGAAHLPMIEQPEAFLDEVVKFLRT